MKGHANLACIRDELKRGLGSKRTLDRKVLADGHDIFTRTEGIDDSTILASPSNRPVRLSLFATSVASTRSCALTVTRRVIAVAAGVPVTHRTRAQVSYEDKSVQGNKSQAERSSVCMQKQLC